MEVISALNRVVPSSRTSDGCSCSPRICAKNERIISLSTPSGVASQSKANPDSYSARSQADGILTERLDIGQVEEGDDNFETGKSSDRHRKHGGNWVGRIPQGEAQASRPSCSHRRPLREGNSGADLRLAKLLEVGTSNTGRQDSKEDMDEASSITNHFKLLEISQRKAALELENKREERFRTSFQPRESANPGEIFPGVIKGKWSDVVHTSQPLLSRVVDITKAKAASALHGRSGEEEATPLRMHETISRFALNFFERQLNLSNPDDHLPLEELSNETYKTLKFVWNSNPKGVVQGMQRAAAIHPHLNRYEFHRRIVTFTTQITQKTILENWPLIKKTLQGGQLKVPQSILNKFEDYFMLTHEFPDVFVWSEKYFSGKHPNWKPLTKKGQNPSSLYLSVVGKIEHHRRQRGTNEYLITKPQWNLSTKLLEEAKQAEKTNGVNVWNIAHVILGLGLGEEKDWEFCEDVEIYNRAIVLDQLLASWYDEIPWFQSADRAWLKRTFKNHYDQQFSSLCRTAAERLYKHDQLSSSRLLDQTDKLGTEKSRGDTMIPKILEERVEQRLMVKEHGLDEKILLTINLLKDQHTLTDGHTIDWSSIWRSWPAELVELDLEQREFAMQWLHNVLVRTTGNIINS
ncbi:hypothetical protein VP01_869g2 [Puccinia sorghi]|uniref:Uncharacterized protein n=1 Tax=Puccinia sorghi TaxID=27349 RepID=A0A0L6U8T4_9BASI|nr:hypothetical protein VP01_869g2 [Puccinia sorghi]